MQNVSQAYKDSMKESERGPSLLQITYSAISIEARDLSTLSDNNHIYYSNLGIKRDVELPQYATLEPGFMQLNKGLLVLPDNSADLENTGYVSEAMSGDNGKFTTPPEITVTFPYPLSFLGFEFTFDSVTGEYPKEIWINNIKCYPDGPFWAYKNEIIAASEVKIKFVDMGIPNRRARLTRVQFGQKIGFETKQITKADFKSNIDFLSTSLSKKTASFTIDNSKDEYNPLNPGGMIRFTEEKQPVEMQFGYELPDGTIEWLPNEKLTLTSTPTVKGLYVTFSAMDKLNSMTGIFYKGLYRPNGITLYALAQEVFADAGVHPDDYSLDLHLQSITTKGALPVVSHSQCLQIIANAGQCILYTDRNGIIKLEVALDPAITLSDNGHVIYSNSSAAYNDEIAPQIRYADLLPGTMPLNNENIVPLPPDEKKWKHVGFVSNKICGTDGTFSEHPIYTISYSFATSNFSIPISFDTILGEYATSFKINYYVGETKVDTYSVTNNTKVSLTVEKSVYKTDRVEIEILKWSVGQRRAIISKVGGGRINDFWISLGEMKEKPVISKLALCKTITINYYNYTLESTMEEIYQEEVGISGQQLTLEINHEAAHNLNATITSGASIVSQDHYTYRSVIVVSGAGTLTIQGKRIVTTTTGVVRQVNPSGEEKNPLENPLITNSENANDTAEWIADYFGKRNQLSVSYRGNPELDAYDTIYMESQFDPYFPVRLMETDLSYNGGISGKIKAVLI